MRWLCVILAGAFWPTSGCGGEPSQTPASGPVEPAALAPPARAEPAAQSPHPAPDGAIVSGRVYVQICAGSDCPSLLQVPGKARCASLKQGGLSWRLPTVEEANAWANHPELKQLEGFHWTSTRFDQDEKQAWIFDPAGGQSTTIPRDRKPFRIRCVSDVP